ncbi:hypothetical protein PG991_010913 [Apiospora marii]|uniref:Uncharacterized protein n=1 Tax=Apiospora marii TaxID=335849 RepID=A0ABR1RCN2_9PEZI
MDTNYDTLTLRVHTHITTKETSSERRSGRLLRQRKQALCLRVQRQRVSGGVRIVAVDVVLQRDILREAVVVDELLHDALLPVAVLVDEDDLAPVAVAVVAARARDAPVLDRVGARVAVGRVRVVRHGQLEPLRPQREPGAVHAEAVDHVLLQVRLRHVLAVAQEGALGDHI